MAVASTAKFHQHFWGEANAGFDVLMSNMKADITASKELGEFIKERIAAEDGYVKGLAKLQKSVGHIPTGSMGAFGPLWDVLKSMCEKLVQVHSQFVRILLELSREIGEYHHSQKEKVKSNMRGEIDQAQESLNIYHTMEAAVHRCRKHYQHSVDHLAKAKGKVERAKADGPLNPKLSGLESRVKQEQAQMETAKGEYQAAVARHCDHVMEYQGKMSEACTKFESIEEEHLAQMFTFMIKIARTQDTMHVGVAELFSTLNSQLDVLTVEKLLKTFVEDKGTGTEKPTPLKFRPIPVVIPTNAGLGASVEDLTTTVKPEKKPRKKEKAKKKAKNASSNGPETQNQAQFPESVPEVDEEGYSIRPQDAANISRFPDEDTSRKASSDSDSDFDEDEPERKIKTLRIRETTTQPIASVEDIKASVMSLRLGAISPLGMKKATSSQSLNILSNTPPPPSAQRKISSTNSSHNLKESSTGTSQPGVASLIDIDLSPSSSGPSMPAPLLPAGPSSKGGAHNIPAPLLPTTTSSTGIRGGGSQIPVPLVPSAAPIPAKVSQANPPLLNFDPKTVDSTASLPVWNFSPHFKASPVLPSTPPTDSPSNSPSIPRPRAGSLKTSPDSPVAVADSPSLGSIPAPPVPSKTKRRSSGTRPSPVSSAGTTATSNSAQISALLLPIPATSKQNVAVDSNLKSKSVDSSPVLDRKSPLSPHSTPPTDDDTPPVPAPRTASLMKSPSPVHMANAVSPLATSQISAHQGGVPSGSAPDKVMPLAIAIHETCNAIFKGTDLNQCRVKVTGEVVISFPTSFLPLLASYEPLTFKVDSREKFERVLHNQHLLKTVEGSSDYTFHMDLLSTHLRKMQEKASAPFYNVQVLKYDVDVSDATKLPLHLVAYMKCEPNTTNFRLDFTYKASVFQSKPTMTNVVLSLPMDGGVKNAITRPTGTWSADTGHMTWTIGDILPSDSPVPTPVHAKFDLASGPSTVSSAVASFMCEGDTVSGLSLNLTSAAYKVSLLKRKCLAGKYVAEPKAS